MSFLKVLSYNLENKLAKLLLKLQEPTFKTKGNGHGVLQRKSTDPKYLWFKSIFIFCELHCFCTVVNFLVPEKFNECKQNSLI